MGASDLDAAAPMQGGRDNELLLPKRSKDCQKLNDAAALPGAAERLAQAAAVRRTLEREYSIGLTRRAQRVGAQTRRSCL
jgi:hypothetical protein